MTPFAAHALRLLMTGRDLNGELDALCGPVRRLADHLATLGVDDRPAALATYLALQERPESERITAALQAADPDGPPPEAELPRFATVADLRALLADLRWLWPGWLPAGRIVGVGAFEGVGKSRFGLDLARRVWHALEWPGGAAPTLPERTPTLWICADANHDELAETMPLFDLPDEAVIFPTPPTDPYGGTDLDDPEFIGPGGTLETAIATTRPGLVFIDTLTNATRRDLCAQDQMLPIKTPLARLCQQYGTTIAFLLHLNREGQALGRRVKGITRTLIHLQCPDPEAPARLRLWVEKSYAKKPAPLGVTMTDGGNEYDDNPPAPQEPNRGGRPPNKLAKALAWLDEKLSAEDRKGCELVDEWEALGEAKGTLFNARRELVADGRLVVDDSAKPQIWHKVRNPGEGQEPGS